MLLESACLAYAGLAHIALARPKYRATPIHIELKPRTHRLMGWALILVSVTPSLIALGGPQGVVTWIGALSLAALTLDLLLSQWPVPTLRTATVVGFLAFLFLSASLLQSGS